MTARYLPTPNPDEKVAKSPILEPPSGKGRSDSSLALLREPAHRVEISGDLDRHAAEAREEGLRSSLERPRSAAQARVLKQAFVANLVGRGPARRTSSVRYPSPSATRSCYDRGSGA